MVETTFKLQTKYSALKSLAIEMLSWALNLEKYPQLNVRYGRTQSYGLKAVSGSKIESFYV